MPRTPRRASESSIYHVINRGEGRQIIFEDDADRAFFMKKLDSLLADEQATLLAWCLMGNHFHLLLQVPFDNLKVMMHRLLTSYAGYFNRVHGHSGVVFGGRFKSEPVETDEYLMTVVRYIHENPQKAGISQGLSYPWSSYQEYCGTARYASTSRVIGIFGGLEQLLSFHAEEHDDDRCLEISDVPRCATSDETALKLAEEMLGKGVVGNLKGFDRRTRDEMLAMLKQKGLSVRQIQRLTGISLGVISNAGKE